MKKTILTIAIIAWTIIGSWAAGTGTNKTFTSRLYGFAEQFEWEEHLDGRQLVKESGPLFGAGGELGFQIANPVWLEGRGELFLGDVDYDGSIMTKKGEFIPYKSTTKYVGIKIEGDAALRLPVSHTVYIKPYAGLGIRVWRRTLDTKTSDTQIGKYGYIEDWVTAYGRLGCEGGITISGASELFARIEWRLPIDNSMTVNLTNAGGPSDVDLEPGERASFYAEGGINATPITVSVFIETLEFSQSSLDAKYQGALQPESESTMIGAKLGLTF